MLQTDDDADIDVEPIDPPTVVVAARFPGRCPDCSVRWEVGEMISPDEHQVWKHAQCPQEIDNALPDAKTAAAQYGALCPDCFIYHRGECA